MRSLFADRHDAGRALAGALKKYAGRPDVVVLGLARGGVVVAYEVAGALEAPLDAFIVRKLGVPGFGELAMGAVAAGGVRVLNEDVVSGLGVDEEIIDIVAKGELRELERREREYRAGRPAVDVRAKTVILVDDGLATGSTMRAAVRALRRLGPAKIVVAVPVGATSTCREMAEEVDEVVCATTPEPFYGVGLWYREFGQTTDEEVRELLKQAWERQGAAPTPAGAPAGDGRGPGAADASGGGSAQAPATEAVAERVRIDTGEVELDGDLVVPAGAQSVVLFAHGSGSSRRSPRNQAVAAALQRNGLGTLLMDLLTPKEEVLDRQTAHIRFDIPLLARRLVGAIDWLEGGEATRGLGIGLLGASTGAGAALVAAAQRPEQVGSVVSRGGRPDLAGEALLVVRCSTLLIVGERDPEVIELNRAAMMNMPHARAELVVVPRASHLFEEPGALEIVARLAGDWFGATLAARGVESGA